MGYPLYNPNHADEVKSFLPTQYSGASNLKDLLDVISKQVQDIEDAFADIYWLFLLDNATAAQLDVLGGIAGESRNEDTDTVYRNRIKARMVFNRSFGSPDTILDFVSFYGDISDVEITEYPGIIYVHIETGFTIDALFLTLLNRLKAGGVKLIVSSVDSSEAPFTFTTLGGPDPEGEGFSDNGVGGGVFASLNT